MVVFDVLVLELENAASLFCCLLQVKAVQSPQANSVPSTYSWIRAFGRYWCIDYTLISSSSYGIAFLNCAQSTGEAITVRRFSTYGFAVTKL